MRPLTLQLASKNGYLNLIILTGLLSGTLITTFIWLEVPNRIITPLSWFSLGLIGLGSFLYLRYTTISRSRWMMILAALAAVSLVYLFPELFGPACGGMPRAFALNCDPKCRIEICTKWVEGPSPECPKPGPGGGCCLSHTTECDPDCEPPPPPNQPPTIQGSLSCSQWGLNGWCASSLSLQLSAVEPQGQNVMISGDINGTAFACPASAGTSTCPVPLPEGSMTANYTATSSTGLTASGSTSFKRDSVKPVIDGWLNGTAGSNSWFISSVDVNASASDLQTGSGMSAFEFKLNNAGWKSYTGPIKLLDGIHSLKLRANDKAGNLVGTNQTIQIDTITPVLNLSVIGTSGANGWYTSTLQINASASDSGSGLSTFEYNLDDTGWISYSNPFELTDGIHSLNFRVIDNAGNNTEGSQTFQVDTLAPVINLSVIGTEGANSWYTSSVQINASVNDAGSGVSALEVSVDGGVWNVYSGPLFFTDGTHTYQFRATDNAGNLNETTAQQVLVDTISPVIDLPESWELGQNTIFKLQDNGSGLASLRLVVEDEDERFPKVSWEEYLKSYKFKGEINWNGRFKDGQVAPSGGEYYARVKVRDVAGNESIRAGQVIVPVASFVEELFLSLGNQTGELISKTEASEIIVELPVPFASDSAQETPSQSTSTSAPSIINLGGNSNKAAKLSSIQAGKTSFNAGGLTNSPISPNNLTNILWGATATAALGAFVAEAARKREALEAAQRASNAIVYKARKLKKQVYALSQQLKKQTEAINQALRNQTAYARVFGKKEVEIEKELRSNLTKAQAGKDALERAKQKAYDIYRAQEVAAQTKITLPKEEEKNWLDKAIDWVDSNQKEASIGIGVTAGLLTTFLVIAVATTAVVSLPVLLVAAGVAAVVAGASVAIGTGLLNNYYGRDLTTNLWSNLGAATVSAAITTGLGLFLFGGGLTSALITVGNGAAAVCVNHQTVCNYVEPMMRSLDYLEEAGLMLKGTIQTWRGDSVGALETMQELQMEYMDGGIPGNAIAKELGEEISEWTTKYGDDVAEFVSLYGDDAVDLIRLHKNDAVKIIRDYGDNGIKLLKNYGDNAVTILTVYGDNGIDILEQYGENILDVSETGVITLVGDNAEKLIIKLKENSNNEIFYSAASGALNLPKSTNDGIKAAKKLTKVGVGGNGSDELIKVIVENSTRGEGDRLVLGKWYTMGDGGGYIKDALDNGGIFLDTGPEISKVMDDSGIEFWVLNEKFLESQLDAGIERIDFVTGNIDDLLEMYHGVPDVAVPYNVREIRWLEANAEGYTRVGNSWIRNH